MSRKLPISFNLLYIFLSLAFFIYLIFPNSAFATDSCTTFILADGSPPCDTKQFKKDCKVSKLQPPFPNSNFTGNECVAISFEGQECVQTKTVWNWTGERCDIHAPPPTATPIPTPTPTSTPIPTPCPGCDPTPTPVCDSASYLTCTSAYDMGSSETKTNMCGDPQNYYISVPDGSECRIDWTLTGLTADYDLYASWTSGLDACLNDKWSCKSTNGGTGEESCKTTDSGVEYLPAGTYHAKVKKYGTGKYDIKGERTCRPAPTPTPIPCSDWKNCTDCVAVGSGRINTCGWKDGSTCQGGDGTCPAGATSWNWNACGPNYPENICAVPPTFEIKGHHVDKNGDDIVLAGQKVTLDDGKSTATTPIWSFKELAPGAYVVTADNINGYTLSHSYCNGCTSHLTYTQGNSYTVTFPDDDDSYVDIYFKYDPIPPGEVTIQGRHVDSAGVVLANNNNIGQEVTIKGPECPNGCTNNTSRGAWNFSKIKIGTYTVTAKIPADYTVSYSLKAGRLSGSNITPDITYTPGNSKEFALSKDKDYIDIYFKYTLIPPGCYVTTSPGVYDLNVGGTGKVTATVTNLPAGKTISQMRFGVYQDNPGVATVSPTSDSSSAYETTVKAEKAGNTAVWATADFVGGGTCASTTDTDTDVNVSAAPPPPPPLGGSIRLILANPPPDTPRVFFGLYDSGTKKWTTSDTIPQFPFTQLSADITGDYLTAYVCIVSSAWKNQPICNDVNDAYSTSYYSDFFPPLSGSVIYFNARDPHFYLAINSFVDLHSRTFPPRQFVYPAEWQWEWGGGGEDKPFDFARINSPYFSVLPTPTVKIGEEFRLFPLFVNPQTSTSDMTLDLLVRRPDGSTFTLGPAFGRIGQRDPGGAGGATYLFTPDQAGTYTGDFTLKANGNVVGNLSNITLLKTPPAYSIKGKIFNDVNPPEGKSNGDPNYTGTISIGLTGNEASFEVTKPGDGTYQTDNLPAGEYTITYSGLPPGITFTYPPSNNGCPDPENKHCVNVSVGPCSSPLPGEAKCSNGSVIDLNAGVTGNEAAWFQSIGADMRWDSGFTNILPSGKYASLPRLGGMPGIIFSGKTTPFFGTSGGQASKNPFNWQVGSPQNPDVFKDTRGLIPTSYRFLKETAERSGIPIKNINTQEYCQTNNQFLCTLSPSLPSGVYITTDYLYLTGPSYKFPENGDFIILVNGPLYIDTKIHVPDTSTVIFSAKDDIAVQAGVGEEEGVSTECDIKDHSGCSIEGLYSADRNFTAGRVGSCPTPSLRLNIAGTVVANAGRNSQNPGIFDNKRSLCDDNSSYPSVTFTERPDFLLNYPSFVQSTTRAWQEIAP